MENAVIMKVYHPKVLSNLQSATWAMLQKMPNGNDYLTCTGGISSNFDPVRIGSNTISALGTLFNKITNGFEIYQGNTSMKLFVSVTVGGVTNTCADIIRYSPDGWWSGVVIRRGNSKHCLLSTFSHFRLDLWGQNHV